MHHHESACFKYTPKNFGSFLNEQVFLPDHPFDARRINTSVQRLSPRKSKRTP
jgi:hypothetical protein